MILTYICAAGVLLCGLAALYITIGEIKSLQEEHRATLPQSEEFLF